MVERRSEKPLLTKSDWNAVHRALINSGRGERTRFIEDCGIDESTYSNLLHGKSPFANDLAWVIVYVAPALDRRKNITAIAKVLDRLWTRIKPYQAMVDAVVTAANSRVRGSQ